MNFIIRQFSDCYEEKIGELQYTIEYLVYCNHYSLDEAEDYAIEIMQ